MANDNPNFLRGFANNEGSLKESIPSLLSSVGWSPTNSKINGEQLNELFYQLFGYINFLQTKGISFWEADRDYTADVNNIDIVRRGDKLYYAKQPSNGQIPSATSSYWGVWFDFKNPNETLYAPIKGDSSQVFEVGNATKDNEAISLKKYYELQSENEDNGLLLALDTSVSLGLINIQNSNELGLIKNKLGVK